MTLNVFRNNNDKNRFTVKHSYDWLSPKMHTALKDVIGVKVHPSMKIPYTNRLSQSAHNYVYFDPNSPTEISNTTVVENNVVEPDSILGAAAKFDLKISDNEFGYIKVDANFTDVTPGKQLEGAIEGTYIHTKVGFCGDLSITTDGLPSIGLTFIDDLLIYGVDVNNYKPL